MGGEENTRERLPRTRERTRATMQVTFLPAEERVEVEGDEDEEDRVRLRLLLQGIIEPKVLVLLYLLPQNKARMESPWPKEVLTRLGLLQLKPH